MKKLLFISIVSLCSLSASAQQGIVWEPEMVVTDGDTRVHTAKNKSVNDLPMVMLGKAGDGEIFIAKGNGTGFNTPVGVVPSGMQTYMQTGRG